MFFTRIFRHIPHRRTKPISKHTEYAPVIAKDPDFSGVPLPLLVSNPQYENEFFSTRYNPCIEELSTRLKSYCSREQLSALLKNTEEIAAEIREEYEYQAKRQMNFDTDPILMDSKDDETWFRNMDKLNLWVEQLSDCLDRIQDLKRTIAAQLSSHPA